MSTIAARILGGLRALFARTRVEHELDDELRAYLDAAVEQKIVAGMTREQAVRAARAEIGSLEAVKDYTRDAGWESTVESFWQDVRYACRSFRRTPAFTTAAVATLAIGIGGTTAIFSVVDGLFLRAPEGVVEPSSVRRIFIRRDSGHVQTPDGGSGSWVDYLTMREDVDTLSGIGAYRRPALIDLGRGSSADQIRAAVVSHNFLTVVGVRPAAGRFFLPEEDGAQGAHPVAVISEAMWRTRFGGATDVLGRTLLLNGGTVEIIGITPRGFHGIDADPVDVWLPSSSLIAQSVRNMGDWRASTGSTGTNLVARLAPEQSEAAAVAQLSAALRQAAQATPTLDQTPEVLPASLPPASRPGGTTEGTLSLWAGLAAALMLLIACANVANLLLARAITRHRELAVQLSIGAPAGRVVRQHLTESMVLALMGGAAGIVVAYWAMAIARQFPLPPSAGRMDGRLLAFALGVTLVTGFIFGLLPALRAVRVDALQALKDSRAVGPATHHRTRRALVIVQVSLSLTLLIGAALFVRSLREVAAIDGGVDIDRLLMAEVDLRRGGEGAIEPAQFYEPALSRLMALPGIESAALVHMEPFGGGSMATGWKVPGRVSPDGHEAQSAYLNVVGPGYFRTAGTRLLQGREIVASDGGGEPVAVVNEALARLMADDGRVVGECVPFGAQLKAGGCTRIVGVVETQRHWYLEAKGQPTVFLAWAQAPDAIPFGTPVILVRTRDEPTSYAPAVRAALQGLRSDLPYVSVRPLGENVRDTVLPFRLGATLFSLFGMLALMLAAIGLYGLLGYFVNERTAEIGLRRSLGAPVQTIVGLVVRQGLIPVAAGLALGLAMAFGGARYLVSLLFGIEPLDPASFAAAALLLACMATVATLVPAWRAARVDPMAALRSE